MIKDRTVYQPAGWRKVRDKQSKAYAFIYEARGFYMAVGYYAAQTKPWFHFGYKTEAERNKKVEIHFKGCAVMEQYKADQRAEKKAKMAGGHKLQVGHILYSSWGYDQTNINWYQVIKLVGKCSVMVQEIGAVIDDGQHWATGTCAPRADAFKGEPMLKRVDAYNGLKINECEHASLWDGKPKTGRRIIKKKDIP